MKKAIIVTILIATMLTATVITAFKITNSRVEFEKRCGSYHHSDYVEEWKEEGTSCRIELTIITIEEEGPVKFLDDWIIE